MVSLYVLNVKLSSELVVGRLKRQCRLLFWFILKQLVSIITTYHLDKFFPPYSYKKKKVIHSISYQLLLIEFSQEQSINVNFIGALAEHKSPPKKKKKMKK